MTRTALYRFFDADDVLLYVGITADIHKRWKTHAGVKPWWGDVTQQTVHWYDDRPTAEAAERIAIATEKPRYNKRDLPAPLCEDATFWDYVAWVAEGQSQVEIASKVGVDKATVWRWKDRRAKTDGATAIAFARAYGRPVLEALVAAGLITQAESEVRVVHVPVDPSTMSPDELQAELVRHVEELQSRAARKSA